MEKQSYSGDNKTIRGRILQTALDATLGDRNKSYGAPTPNLELAASMIALYHKAAKGKYCQAHDQAVYMVLHKIARVACGAKNHTDNYVDAAAYAAIAAECQELADAVMEVAVENAHAAVSAAMQERRVPRYTITPVVPDGWKRVEAVEFFVGDFVLLNNGLVYRIEEKRDFCTYNVLSFDNPEIGTMVKTRAIVCKVIGANRDPRN